MTITITLTTETEEKLRSRAAENGLTLDDFTRRLIEEGLNGTTGNGPNAALSEVLAPFRKEVADSGITDDELKDFFTEVRDEVRAEK
jgi:hypothetical protein